MRETYKPHPYQLVMEKRMFENKTVVVSNGGGAAFVEMGMGKTVVACTVVRRLMFEELEINRTLVIAPKRVADHVWTSEIAKWEHLEGLTVSKVLGSEKERIAALKVKADIYTINCENVVWLVAYLGSAWNFDMVILDELTKFKSAKAARFKALRQVRPKIKRVVGLTGTPAPNGLLDLWAQLYLLDRGERLGPTLTGYREKYFTINSYEPFAKHKIKREKDELIGDGYYERKIYERISDICFSLKAADYLDLPDKIFNDIPIVLSPAARAKYEEFEKEQVLALMTGEEITAVNAGVLTNKLLQFANGAVYDDSGAYHEVHDAKLDELEEIIEDANGKPVLIFYSYRHDAERIRKRLAKYKPVDLKGSKEIDRWNRGEISVMIAHPASAGHGLNLQAGGNIIVFFGLLWSLELYLQAIARLHRQGQQFAVIIHRLICTGTYDELVVAALDHKDTGQQALINAVRATVVKHIPGYYKKAG